jgi:hypothetical protein
MTEVSNLPVLPDRMSLALEQRQDTDSWIGVMADVAKLAPYIAETEFVPKSLRGKPAAVAAAILSGRELGLPPMTAMQLTYVVDGRPGVSAEGMRSLVFAAGHDIEFTESTGAICTVRGRRRFREGWTEVTWTIDMARSAGLDRNPAWRAFPRAMLQARATTELCRMVFPDVIHGFRSLEELEDMAAGNGVPAPAEPAKRTATVQRASRKRATSGEEAASAPALPAAVAAEEPPAPGQQAFVPPLPGEPGYDTLTPQTGGGVGAPDGAPEDRDTDPAPAEVAGGELPSPPAAADQPAEHAGDRPITRKQVTAIQTRFGELGLGGQLLENRRRRLGILERIANRPVGSTNDLTVAEGSVVLDTLARVESAAQLQTLLAEVIAAGAEQTALEEEPEPEDEP